MLATVPAPTPSVLLGMLRAAGDILYIDEGGGFCAGVRLTPARVPAIVLARSTIGAAHEGELLRQVMLTSTGMRQPGYYHWRLDASDTLTRS